MSKPGLQPIAATDIWGGVDRLIARAPSLEDLVAHRLGLLALAGYRARGEQAPPILAAQELMATVTAVTAPTLLRIVRAAAGGPVVLLKGPELAARYPRETLRSYGDLDLLVPDAPAFQQALRAAGFRDAPGNGAETPYHARRLQWEELPLLVEVHSRPNWPARMRPPTPDLLFERLAPSVTGLDGIQALPPDRHAMVVAAHAWAHGPLGTLRDLIDVAVLIEGIDRDDLQQLADSWRMGRMWRTTIRAVDSLVLGARTPGAAQRIWARHLSRARERTVFEWHLESWLSALSAFPLPAATRAVAAALVSDVLPAEDEIWEVKLRRSRLALRNAFLPRSRHHDILRARASPRDAEGAGPTKPKARR